uniref:Zinc carboxypeptidase n=1 Tax=Candidatus Kentrum sp. FW TaxID=2126338 RepID=A0A450SQG8_9GAMM|nr:MAG: Zinc carboxypeptidase [Candidatus Kentron sp. FW]VFJ56185.1 MAG: Zinc carboxypeptidase [Candidatus Kentron sp. FW]
MAALKIDIQRLFKIRILLGSLLISLVSPGIFADGVVGNTVPGVIVASGSAAPLSAPPIDDIPTTAQMCERIGRKLDSVDIEECLAQKLLPTDGLSVWRQPILGKEYPPLAPRRPRARVLLFGGIHGDEYSSVSIVFKWMKILDKHHSGLFHWYFVPLLNPDGLLRKNSQRMNANDVDLNRNFPPLDGDEKSSLKYWSWRTKRNPRRYPGPRPLSEPESRWLARKIDRFRPDAIIALHAPYGIVDFDGPPKAPERLGRLRLNLLGTYPGSLGNYAALQKQIPVVTLELRYAGILPEDMEMRRIWVDLVKWLIRRFPKPE